MNNIESINPLFCDPETGVCEIPVTKDNVVSEDRKKLRMIYFTDPICSTCWGIEPQIRKLKAEYGDYFDVEYKMGGLLKSWNEYGGTDVRSATEVAKHWEEVGAEYDMPINGDVWLEDPLDSSYPPSIAFKAVELQNQTKAVKFLRRMREMLFLEKKNITKWENMLQAAIETGVDVEQFRKDFDVKGKQNFEADLELKREMGVRGFPTIYFRDSDDNQFKVYGYKPYKAYEDALLKLFPHAIKKQLPTSDEKLFALFNTVTTKEYAELSHKSVDESVSILSDLADKNKIERYSSKNGDLWKSKAAV